MRTEQTSGHGGQGDVLGWVKCVRGSHKSGGKPSHSKNQQSGSSQPGGEEGGALGHGFHDDMLVRSVRTIANGTEAIQCRNAKRGGEVAIGTATCGGFAKG